MVNGQKSRHDYITNYQKKYYQEHKELWKASYAKTKANGKYQEKIEREKARREQVRKWRESSS